MLSYEERRKINAALEAIRPQLVDAVLVDMYKNPFWNERFGERGIVRAREDVHYNLDFLIAAILMDHPGSLVDYYNWLQSVLVNRGMCTLHLRQTLDTTERHLVRLLPAEIWAKIESIVDAQAQGLAYQHPACRALAAVEAAVAEAATRRMPVSHEGDPRKFQSCLQDNLFHLSYLQDAVSNDNPAIFEKYLAWIGQFLASFKVPAEDLDADLKILAEEIARCLAPEDASPFLKILAYE